jgi:predicted acylesterase/phospholipase RssA
MTASNRKIGLALGSGSARGMSHIGVIRELEQLGIRPDIMLVPRLGEVGLLEFDKSAESIAAGRHCVRSAQTQLTDYLGVKHDVYEE